MPGEITEYRMPRVQDRQVTLEHATEEMPIAAIEHAEPGAVIEPEGASTVAAELWAQQVETTTRQAIALEYPPAALDQTLLLEFSGNANVLAERLGQDVAHDIKIADQFCDKLQWLGEQMHSVAGKTMVAKIWAALDELKTMPNDVQRDLTKVAEEMNYNRHSSQPEFARGAHVFVTPTCASELPAALAESDLQAHLGSRHVLVTESTRPLVEAAVDTFPRSSTNSRRSEYRRSPKVKKGRVMVVKRPTFTWEHSARIKECLKEVGTLSRQVLSDDGDGSERLTHSTGSRPHPWLFQSAS